MKLIPASLALLAISLCARAQVRPPNASGISLGHLHLNSKDPVAQAKFWTEAMGARTVKLGPLEIYKLPGVLIIVKKADPTAGTDGSVIDHVGLKVRDLKATLAKIDAAPIQVLSRNDRQAMLLAPDDLKVELTEVEGVGDPVASHHIHFYIQDVDQTKKWYVDTFGAIAGKRGNFEAADLPGVNLTFTSSDTVLPGTKGRVLDHIGFEVNNLEAFTKKLEAGGTKFDIPYRTVPALGIAIAFFTDPWGTYIELTEGLNKL